MRRREFITLLGGVAAGWSLKARAQQPDCIRRIGALLNYAADDPEGQSRVATFQTTLRELGWTEGQSFKIDYRWRGASAAELVELAPDVIVVAGTSNLAAAQQASRTIPIVFVGSHRSGRQRLRSQSRTTRRQFYLWDLACSNTAWAANGWSFLNKLLPV